MSANPHSRSHARGGSAPPPKPGVTVRKAPFPIALILRSSFSLIEHMVVMLISVESLGVVLTAVTLTILSVYVPDLIHVTEVSPGPTHFETK